MSAAPDNTALQVFYGTLPLIGTAVLAIWNNNSRLNEISKRIDDVIVCLGKVEDRLSDLEKGSRMLHT